MAFNDLHVRTAPGLTCCHGNGVLAAQAGQGHVVAGGSGADVLAVVAVLIAQLGIVVAAAAVLVIGKGHFLITLVLVVLGRLGASIAGVRSGGVADLKGVLLRVLGAACRRAHTCQQISKHCL